MDKQIAERLYEQRKTAGISQEELAEKIGVSRQAVSKWERGESSPDTENLIALAKLYNVSLDELVFGSSEKAQKSTEKDTIKDEVKVGLSGIHVNSKNGENVNIDWKGIHVNTPTANVHVDGEFVGSINSGHIFPFKSNGGTKVYRFFKKFPYPILSLILYLTFGSFGICGGWAYGWLIFLTIPLYYTLVTAIAHKNAALFAYPILTVYLYLILGFYVYLWHPGWIIFLTIPVYYFICKSIKKPNKK